MGRRNNEVVEPGVIIGYERNEATSAKLATAGIEVLAIAGEDSDADTAAATA